MPFDRMMGNALPTGVARTNLMPNFADNTIGPFAGQQNIHQYARQQGMTIRDLRGDMRGQQWRDFRRNQGWLNPQGPAPVMPPVMPPANPTSGAYIGDGGGDPYRQALSPIGPMAYHFGTMLARQPGL